jgi:YvbH-like oligomerisation region
MKPETKLEYAQKSLMLTANVFGRMKSGTNHVLADFKAVNELAFQWPIDAKTKYTVKDFGFVLERYIDN